MTGLKNNARSIWSFLIGKKVDEKPDVDAKEVIPGVKAGSPHLKRVAVYIPRKELEFYLDGQIVSKDGRGVRLVNTRTGLTMTMSKEVFDYMFEQKEK